MNVVELKSFDFGPLPDGATLPVAAVACEWVIGPVERIDGALQITLLLPHPDDAPEHVRFPSDIINPADGPVLLPTGVGEPAAAVGQGVIDWSQVVTQEMKDRAAVVRHLSEIVAETAARRAVADAAIEPLQDAVDLDEATETETAQLKAWKKYRIALIRVPDQLEYPDTIDWPAPPA
ncbi:tail fiber assembly protein [Pseudomonas sp. JV241A]|uniref:tail fiber assembly protein n=1 Tax=Pseudomonas sp. JV241A TaxID=2078785 RepID=UPI00100C99BB|nr:tail fiber assembly protein [Pseudomonas sp. JV241A]SPO69494.1 conserved protein of unknown function [Pseudomonas sp. JV241A]